MPHITEISEDSFVERDLADCVRAVSGQTAPAYSPAPTYVEAMAGQPALPRFASWDRTWYSGEHSGGGHGYTARRPDTDDLVRSEATDERSHSAHWAPVYDDDVREPAGHFSPARYDAASSESDDEDGAGEKRQRNKKAKRKGPISARKKAERVKMLEKAFGTTPRSREDQSAAARLAPIGTKKRAATRIAQVLLSFAIVLGSVGGWLLTHPKDDARPAVQGRISTIILHILSIVSLLSTLWLYVLRRCCTRQRAATNDDAHGRFVIPVSSGIYDEEAGCCCGGRRKKQRKGGVRHGGPVVNLVIDPAAFAEHLARRGETRERDDVEQQRRSSIAKNPLPGALNDGEEDEEGSDAASFVVPKVDEPARYDGKRLPPRRPRLPFSTVGLFCFDALLGLLWLAEVIFAVGFNSKCPPGTSSGYCDGYNAALASAVFLAIACFVAVFLGMRDRRR